MLPLRRLPKRRHIPIQLPQPPMNIRIPTPHIPDIRLEMLHINHIESYHRGIQPHIGLGYVFAIIVWAISDGGEVFFDAVQRGKERGAGCFVGGGCGREAGFVDAVVDGVVGPFVCGFDFGLEG